MTGNRVSDAIGGDALSYNGLQSVSDPHVSAWRMQFLGGARFTDGHGNFSDTVFGLTGSDDFIRRTNELFSTRRN